MKKGTVTLQEYRNYCENILDEASLSEEAKQKIKECADTMTEDDIRDMNEVYKHLSAGEGFFVCTSDDPNEKKMISEMNEMISIRRVENMTTSEAIRAAQAGDLLAMDRLYLGYATGQYGMKINWEKAAYWAKKLADEGESYAQFNVAGIYASGNGFERDWDKAIYYMSLAAEQNEPDADWILEMFIKGREYEKKGLEGDEDAMFEAGKILLTIKGPDGYNSYFREAFEVIKKSAEMGSRRAQVKLGEMYLNGIGTRKSRRKAMEALRGF